MLDIDETKDWMLRKGECEGLDCPHFHGYPYTRDEPAGVECSREGECPFGDKAQTRFIALRDELLEEAVCEECFVLAPHVKLFAAGGDPEEFKQTVMGVVNRYVQQVMVAKGEI